LNAEKNILTAYGLAGIGHIPQKNKSHDILSPKSCIGQTPLPYAQAVGLFLNPKVKENISLSQDIETVVISQIVQNQRLFSFI